MLRRVVLSAVVALGAAAPAAGAAVTVRDGNARFQVVTPTLVRLELAPDGRFEDRPTQTTGGRLAGARPRVVSRVSGADRVITTDRIVVRWRRGSDRFDATTLRVRLRDERRVVRPATGPNPAPLGGWRRSLDLVDGPVPLFEGVLSKAGWYLLDDTETALLTPGGFAPRETGRDGYQDLHLFAYGRDLARGLRDLRVLTGPVPLLPRKAFGVWFSRWWPYGDGDWRELVERFRAERVPLDTISLDTDFKRVHDEAGAAIAATVAGAPGLPYSWNGWDWNRALYPDPAAFLRYADEQGIEVGLNVHPSISSSDPRFAETQTRAGGKLTPSDGCRIVQADPYGTCNVFDWTDPKQLAAYFALHEPFERDGTDFWWLDWCCDLSRADAPGLTPDTWINQQYAERQRARGSRWPAFSRIGGSLQAGFGGAVGNGALAEHRHTLQFTGDTCGSWPLLGFAAEYTAAAGSIGMAYVSHDIGSFHGVSSLGICNKDVSPYLTPTSSTMPPEMYARWVQLGVFQPLERLHSHHGKRLPWEYPGKPGQVAADALRLRERLGPTFYALAHEAHATGLPMARALYLTWPGEQDAYAHPSQYTLGKDVLVAPVSVPGDPAQVEVWFPPGAWTDLYTGERYRGPATRRLAVPLERYPVFVRDGAIVATQPDVPTTPAGPPPEVVLTAYRGSGGGRLYDDAGDGLAYERGEGATTRLTQRRAGGTTTLTIGPARGRFPKMPRTRTYELRVVGIDRPRSATVAGRRTAVTYDAATRTATVRTRAVPTRRAARVVVR